MPQHQSSQSRYLVLLALGLSRTLASFVVLLSVLCLLGYLTGTEWLYRPSPSTPATHPFTAMSFLLLALCFWQYRSSNRAIKFTFLVLGASLITTKLFDMVMETQLTDAITPFTAIAKQEHLQSRANSVGVNTLISLALIWLSLAYKVMKKPLASQVMAFAGLALPMVSLFGYAYGITNFYGEMSLFTTFSLGLLSSVAMLSTANHGAIRAMLSPYIGGKIARFQFLIGFAAAFTLGYLVVRSIANIEDSSLVGAYAVGVCWLIVALVTASAIMQERADKQRRRMEKKLQIVARQDALTGLLNRRAFNEAIHYEVLRSKRHFSDTGLIVLDIDHFKRINDTLGHAKGDVVLQAVAKQLKKKVRNTDIVCRFGGEEFAILLPETNTEGTTIVANSICRLIEEYVIADEEDSGINVTISAGCSNIVNGDYALAFERADKALYTAKKLGRNRVNTEYDHDIQRRAIERRSENMSRALAYGA